MTTVAELVAVLRADARQFSATMNTAQGEVAALSAETTAASGMMSKAMLGIGVAAAAGIVMAVKSFQSWASTVKGIQRVTGGTAEEASKLAVVADEMGINITSMTSAFGLFAKNVASGAPALERYGISATKANGETKTMTQILLEASDEYIALGGGIKGTAFAMAAFGRGGRAIIPILGKGRDALREMMQEAEKLGLVMSQDDLDAAKALTIAERRLGETFKGIGVTIGREFIPVVTEVVEEFQKVVEWIGRLNPDLVANALRFGVLLGAIAGLNKAGVILLGWGKTAIGMMGTLTGATTGAAASMTTLEASEVDATIAGKLFVANAQGVVISEREVAASAAVATDALVVEGNATVTAAGKMKSFAAGAWAARGGILAFALGIFAAKNEIDDIFKGADDLAHQFSITEDQAEALQARMHGPLLGGDWKDIGHNLADMNPFAHGVEEASTAFKAFAAEAVAAGRSQEEINAAFDASLPLLNGNRASIEGFSDALYKNIGLQQTQTGALEDTTTAMDDLLASSEQMKHITEAEGLVAQGTAELAAVSGQDLSKISMAYQELTTNVKATTEDYLEVLGQMQGAQDAFTASTISAFGGASGALSEFSGQNKVDFGKMEDSLASYKSDLRDWGTAFREILRNGGKDARTFLADQRAEGLDSLGRLQSVAAQSKENQRGFLDMYNTANAGTESLADAITHKLVPKFDLMIDRLTSIAVKMGAIPDPNIDFSQVLAGLSLVKQEAIITSQKLALAQMGQASPHGGGHPHGPNGGYFGGLVSEDAIRRFGRGGIAEDNIPAWLSAGEFVMSRKTVSRYGIGTMRAMNEGLVPAAMPARMPTAKSQTLKVQIRPDRHRFVRDLDEDYLERGW